MDVSDCSLVIRFRIRHSRYCSHCISSGGVWCQLIQFWGGDDITDLPRGKGGLPPGDHWVAGRGHRHSGTTWAICPSVHWWVSLKSVNIIMVAVRCWFFNCLHFFYIGILLGKKKMIVPLPLLPPLQVIRLDSEFFFYSTCNHLSCHCIVIYPAAQIVPNVTMEHFLLTGTAGCSRLTVCLPVRISALQTAVSPWSLPLLLLVGEWHLAKFMIFAKVRSVQLHYKSVA